MTRQRLTSIGDWEPLGDAGALLRLGDDVDASLNSRVHAVAARLRAAAIEGITDIVPAFASLAVVFAPTTEPQLLLARLRALPLEDEGFGNSRVPAGARTITLPVCYDGADLDALSRHAGLTPEEVVARHAGGRYRVAMLGFQPGFPYLLGLDPALAMPRRAAPRTRVPAGSVSIGGAQTGIYPRESPGGWNIVGRTPAVLFDAHREPPSLLLPGDAVRFRPITPEMFAHSSPEVGP